MADIYVFVTAFWLCPLVMIIFHSWRDTQLFESNGHTWWKLWNNLRWDLVEEHRSPIKSIIKVIAATLLIVGLIYPLSLPGYIGVFVLQAIWFNNLVLLIYKAKSGYLPRKSLSLRSTVNLVIIAALVGLVAALILRVSMAPQQLSFMGLELISLQQLLQTPISGQNIDAILWANTYVFMVCSALAAVMFDLGSVVVVDIVSMFTKPIKKLQSWWTTRQIKSILDNHSGLITIAVAGDHHRRFTKKLLYELLQPEFNVAKPHPSVDSENELLASLRTSLKKDTQILIVEISDDIATNTEHISSLLEPKFMIITGINEHLGSGYSSTEKLLSSKQSLLNTVSEHGTLILNLDDHLLADLRHQPYIQHIGVHSKQISPADPTDNEINTYKIQTEAYNKEENITRINIIDHSHREIISSNVHGKAHNIANSIGLAAATVQMIGINWGKVSEKLNEINLPQSILSRLPIQEQSALYRSEEPTTLASLQRDVEFLQHVKGKSRILVTKGFADKRKYTGDVDGKFVKLIADDFDFVLTYDPELVEYIESSEEFEIKAKLVSNIEQTIKVISRRAKPGNVFLVSYEIDTAIVKYFIDR